jgi:hypothetical protein
VYAIDNEGHPFLSYVGVNFTQTTIKNYKFYFSFFKRLSEDEIRSLLPVADRGRFDAFYDQWHPTQRYTAIHRGTTFALKVEADGTLTHYYHLRVRGLPFGDPERLELAQCDRDNFHGVCEEFTGDRIHEKRYFYCRDRTTIARSLQIAGLPDETSDIDCLEYIESEGRDKMAWITGEPNLVRELLYQRGQPRLASGLAKICHDCGFVLFGPGSARDGKDHSIYFIEPGGRPLEQGGRVFDGVKRFAIGHLKLDRFPDPE